MIWHASRDVRAACAARSSKSSSSSLAGGSLLEILAVDDHVAGRAGHYAFARAFERLRAPPRRRRAAARPGPLRFPCRGFRRPGEKRTKVTRRRCSCAPRCRGDLLARFDQLLLRRVAAEAEADRRARLRDSRARAPGGHGLAVPNRWRRRCPSEKAMSRRSAISRARVDAVAADIEIAVVAAVDAAVDGPVGSERVRRAAAHKRCDMIMVAVACARARASPPRQSRRTAPATASPSACPAPARRRGSAARARRPCASTSAPMPFGPWILWAETATRSGPSGICDPAKALHRIAQHQRADAMRHARDLGDRLDDPDLIVDQHDRDQQRSGRRARLSSSSRSSQAVSPDRQDGEVEPVGRKPLARVEHRGMFGRDGDDPVALRLVASAFSIVPFERPVDRLGRAPGEGDAAAVEPDASSTWSRAHARSRRPPRGPSARASADWRTGPPPTAASRRRLRAPAASSPGNRDRSCRRATASLGESPPFGEEAVDVGLARVRPEADPKDSRAAISGSTPMAASTWLAFRLARRAGAARPQTAIPARSSWTSIAMLVAPGSAMAPMVGDARRVLAR